MAQQPEYSEILTSLVLYLISVHLVIIVCITLLTFIDIDQIMTISQKKNVATTLIKRHPKLTHTEGIKVISHVQRESDDWQLNTLMLAGVNVPFKYKRKKRYKSLKDCRVNITYYPDNEKVAGFEIEIMKIVRIKVS
ncbi:MAG: hypothetical protein ACJAXJ_000737 [Colwellia sp.]|jgi:hypothetical protein|tara:strand:- start:8272 stop:8682 length:411 start_codon:yes stop_codon:yes gene_type:complete